MRMFLAIALVVAVIAVGMNDGGRYSNTKYDLGAATERIADEVANSARGLSRDQAATLAARLGEEAGIRVYQYDQNGQEIFLWTEATLRGTWILGPYLAWRAGKPLDTPPVVRDSASVVYR